MAAVKILFQFKYPFVFLELLSSVCYRYSSISLSLLSAIG
jgi:uncharacterized membrane protein